MTCSVHAEPEEALAELVHDLRQPLGTLQYSALYLQILIGDSEGPAQQQLRIIQRQIEVAARMIDRAAARAGRPANQRPAAGASLDFTKSETAAVT